VIGYVLWIFGFTGSHPFYFGKPISRTIWFFTGGLFVIGWLIDLFLIPSMARRADLRYVAGPIDYSVAWILLTCRCARGSAVLPGQMGNRPSLPGDDWPVRHRPDLRFLDPQLAD